MSTPNKIFVPLFSCFIVTMLLMGSLPADACSGPACLGMTVAAPKADATLPLNVPALAIRTLMNRKEPLASEIQLFTEDGSAVAVDIQSNPPLLLIRPQASLADGAKYRLQYFEHCDDPLQSPIQIPFSVGPSQPLPTRLGSVTASASSREMLEVNAGSLCSDQLDAAVVRLQVHPSAELIPFMPVAEWSLMVDGQRWANAFFGTLTENTTPSPSTWFMRVVATIHGACEPNGQRDPGVALGHHQGELHVSIPGMTQSIEPAPFEFDLTCGTKTATAGCSAMAGNSSAWAAILVVLGIMAQGRRRHLRGSTARTYPAG